jgi:muramidase (phage lysozyme)
MATHINPNAYTQLLNTIAEGESRGSYNAYFGHAGNDSIRFTDMTIAEVLQWQKQYVQDGSNSSAVGRYQIIRPTLTKLVHELNVDPDAPFNAVLQDRMAIALLERRGSIEYVDNKISREQFAANLSREWAALPKIMGPNPQESYYAADGVNASRISIDAVYQALDKLKE